MNPLLVTTVMALEGMDNITLATANNGLSGFGRVPKESLAYKPFLDAVLIEESGRPRDAETLEQALSYEINRRVEAGTFN